MPPGGRPVVLQILTQDGVGGTEHMLAALIERSGSASYRMELVTLDRPGPIADRAARAGVRVRSLGGRRLPVAFARLARLIARERFDVVNAYGFKATAVARVLTRLLSPSSAFVCGVRSLHPSEVEQMDSPKARIVLFLERLCAPLVDVYDSNSVGALELLASLGVPRSKLHYIANGIDAAGWPNGNRDSHEPPVILCVARFVPRKRHVDLVAAAELLAHKGVQVRLVLAGTGPTLETIRAQAELAAAEIRLAGEVVGQDLRDLYAQADVFCLCSTFEGMAGAVMEAMASSLPVVATQVNGITDLVVHNETGLLVEPMCPEPLARALEELLTSPSRRRAFGSAGRTRIEACFSVDRMVREKETLYLQAAGRS